MMLLRQYEGKNVAVCCNRSENPWTLPHSGTILLGGGIAEYTGETSPLGRMDSAPWSVNKKEL